MPSSNPPRPAGTLLCSCCGPSDFKRKVGYISRHFTLVPGDVILTGTPEGVMMGQPAGKRRCLAPGVEVVVEIENLGRLVNTYL